MKVYVHDDKTRGAIVKACKALQCNVLTVQDVRARKFSPQHAARQEFFLDAVDLLIVEITRPTQDIHFILAQAIITKKPTLCVYGKNQMPRELLSFIKRDEAGQSIKTFSYIEEQLGSVVQDFVKRHHPQYAEHMQMPDIKFTLRLTKRIHAFLEKKSEKTGKTKADIIRDILEEQTLEYGHAHKKRKGKKK
ncbi:MAG: hypothetical protein KIH62_004455 [Candidatus Kerfeldbacteria bacterium]|nr:hypothetical protein [Candidatus Kerfeldbacteria bacterium]